MKPLSPLAVFGLIVALAGCVSTSQPQSTEPAEPAYDEPELHTIEPPIEIDATDTPDSDNEVSLERDESKAEKNFASAEEAVPAAPEDLWERVRRQMTLDVPDNKRVKAQRRWYMSHPSYMERVSKRAEPFLYLIVEEMEKNNMPMELVLLPIVESAFDPFAYSHGRASGMWQFIPGTGKRFGLKQNWWYDGRRDAQASTEAAIKYLKYLNKFFDGNWMHALAAYNSGEGRVRKAIRNNKRKGKSTDFWSLDLPKETRAYVPKLLALADMLSRAEELGVHWPSIPNTPQVESIDVGSQIDLALAAGLADLTVDELHRLNPGYNRWATAPNGPHTLLIPIDKAESFKAELADTSDKERLNWVRYKVKSGDSLIRIANKYHTTPDIVRKVNGVSGNMIRVGQHLLIPVATQDLSDYGLSVEQRLAKTQTRKRGQHKVNYTVRSGDNLWDISRKYKVNHRQLAKWNGMAPTDTLKLGQKLVIWQKQSGASAKSGDNKVMRSISYRVRRGDSIARIAQKFKVRVKDVVRWNQLDPKKYLQPGQMLKLYVDVTEISA